ncbi:hypothetical protein M9H77_14160 [Catharanthus roseus]|uniref:Uncharacterized protein n=1 Tax=Catharanthus roseus TaxID=4058 RepID=A0ACC0BMI3_CATRO|nr:hypothetical protein M9H77_14160 [Catharanthus roseus]
MDKELKKNSTRSPMNDIPYQWVLSRIGGRDIAFDDRLLNHILETPQDGIRFYTKNKKCFDQNLYSERCFEEIFTRGEVLKGHDDKESIQSSSTKCLPYGCFITKIFQYFVINLVGISGHIGHGKIYNQQTFKRMGFEKNEEGAFIRDGQEGDGDDEEDDDEDQEGMNVEEEESEEETEAEIHRREQDKRRDKKE